MHKVYAKKAPHLRPTLDIDTQFGILNSEKQKLYIDAPFEKFLQYLRDKKLIKGQIKVLQKNIWRARVVFSGKNQKGESFVIKWTNLDAPSTYGKSKTTTMECYMHGSVAKKLNKLIPKLKAKFPSAIMVEKIEGKPISFYLKNKKTKIVFDKILIQFLDELKTLYLSTKRGKFTATEFNDALLRDHDYMRQIRGSIKFKEIFGLMKISRNLEGLYTDFIQNACLAFSQRK